MPYPEHPSGRNEEREAWERRRYEILERVYLLTGSDCEKPVDLAELEHEFGSEAMIDESIIEELEQLGYLRLLRPGARVCITIAGAEYLQTRAWRRRSIRSG